VAQDALCDGRIVARVGWVGAEREARVGVPASRASVVAASPQNPPAATLSQALKNGQAQVDKAKKQ
jgi:hypothetical protein